MSRAFLWAIHFMSHTQADRPLGAQYQIKGVFMKVGLRGLVYKHSESRGWIRHTDKTMTAEHLACISKLANPPAL